MQLFLPMKSTAGVVSPGHVSAERRLGFDVWLRHLILRHLIHRCVSSHVSGSQVEICAFHLCLQETEDHKMQSSPGSVEFTQGWNLIPCSKRDKMMNDFNTLWNYWSRGHVLNGMIHTLFLHFSLICHFYTLSHLMRRPKLMIVIQSRKKKIIIFKSSLYITSAAHSDLLIWKQDNFPT